MDVADRVVGSVLGVALGDALGAPFEFSRGSTGKASKTAAGSALSQAAPKRQPKKGK